jgi:hypothetical protein
MRDKNLEGKLLIACKELSLCCTEDISVERANDYGVIRASRYEGKYLQNALKIERAATEKPYYRLVYLKVDSSAHYALPGMSAMECFTLKELKAFLDGIIVASRVLYAKELKEL